MTNGGLWQIGWIWMSLTEKNVSGVPLIAFTAVSYVCASCLSLGACSCSSHVEGWQLLPLHCLQQWCRAGRAGGRYGRDSRESWSWAELGAGFSWINTWEWEWKVLERHLQEAGWQQWHWVVPLGALLGHTISIAPFPLEPLIMLILVILFFIFYFSSLTSSHRLFLFSFQLLLFSPTAIPAAAVVLTLVGLLTQTFSPDMGGNLLSPPTLFPISPLPSGRVEPCSIRSIFRWFIRGF